MPVLFVRFFSFFSFFSLSSLFVLLWLMAGKVRRLSSIATRRTPEARAFSGQLGMQAFEANWPVAHFFVRRGLATSTPSDRQIKVLANNMAITV